MQDAPNKEQLLKALQEFLSDEVLPGATDGRLRFRTLVAVNVLRVLERELVVGEEASLKAEWARLDQLLGESRPAESLEQLRIDLAERNRELCARIRSGHPPEGCEEHGHRTVVDKLAVSNPEYLSHFQPL